MEAVSTEGRGAHEDRKVVTETHRDTETDAETPVVQVQWCWCTYRRYALELW